MFLWWLDKPRFILLLYQLNTRASVSTHLQTGRPAVKKTPMSETDPAEPDQFHNRRGCQRHLQLTGPCLPVSIVRRTQSKYEKTQMSLRRTSTADQHICRKNPLQSNKLSINSHCDMLQVTFELTLMEFNLVTILALSLEIMNMSGQITTEVVCCVNIPQSSTTEISLSPNLACVSKVFQN